MGAASLQTAGWCGSERVCFGADAQWADRARLGLSMLLCDGCCFLPDPAGAAAEITGRVTGTPKHLGGRLHTQQCMCTRASKARDWGSGHVCARHS